MIVNADQYLELINDSDIDKFININIANDVGTYCSKNFINDMTKIRSLINIIIDDIGFILSGQANHRLQISHGLSSDEYIFASSYGKDQAKKIQDKGYILRIPANYNLYIRIFEFCQENFDYKLQLSFINNMNQSSDNYDDDNYNNLLSIFINTDNKGKTFETRFLFDLISTLFEYKFLNLLSFNKLMNKNFIVFNKDISEIDLRFIVSYYVFLFETFQRFTSIKSWKECKEILDYNYYIAIFNDDIMEKLWKMSKDGYDFSNILDFIVDNNLMKSIIAGDESIYA